MKGASVGEYLILFGALIAVVGTSVISLGRLIIFQAETAQERHAQALADEIASAINEISASPDGAYYVLDPTRTRYNITLTKTRVVVEKEEEKTVSTHLGREIIPTMLDSTQKLCVQKSLGKIQFKKGECLSCTDGDGFCDQACDALGKCDTDCITGNDGYCSKSCSVLEDGKCDLDCAGKNDGIWDPDCGTNNVELGCLTGWECDPDSKIEDGKWDPCCTEGGDICDPDFKKMTNQTDPDCENQNIDWHSNFKCKAEIIPYDGNQTLPLFITPNTTIIRNNCSINATAYQLYYDGIEEPLGEFTLKQQPTLVIIPQEGEGTIYFNQTGYSGTFLTDLLITKKTMVNQELKLRILNQTTLEARNLDNNLLFHTTPGTINQTITHQTPLVIELKTITDEHNATYQMFSKLPGIRTITSEETTHTYSFPPEYELTENEEKAYAENDNKILIYCNQTIIKTDNKISCNTQQSWAFLCKPSCTLFEEWISDHHLSLSEFSTRSE